MALYDSADCLARCIRYAKRPATDQFIDSAGWYALLTEAQIDAYTDIAPRAPRALMGAPTLLTTADSGLTYSFGTDADSNPVFPMGHTEVYGTADGQELYASTFSEREGDFVIEGLTIRIPGNQTRTFSSGPYARFVQMPGEISASKAPTLEPLQFRGLLVARALVKYCLIGPSLRDERPFEKEYNQLLGKYLLAYKTAMKAQNDSATFRWLAS